MVLKGILKKEIDSIIYKYSSKKYVNSSNMSFANAMFIKNNYKSNIKEDYINDLKNNYNADVIYDDFSKPDTINNYVSNKTFKLINNLLDSVEDLDFVLVNALAIDMEWDKNIQADSEHYLDRYDVSFNHEDYGDYIPILEDNNFKKIKFNNKDVNSLEIGATVNNYDIVKELGRSKIYDMIKKEYEEYLDSEDGKYYIEYLCNPIYDLASECENAKDSVSFTNNFIKELDSNYKQVITSTSFKMYKDDNIKVFSKELKEYNGVVLEYVAIMPNDLNTFIKKSDSKSVLSIINKLKPISTDSFSQGKVYKIKGDIPIFKYEYELNLKDDLKKIGITSVFDKNKADLSNMTKDNAFIDKTVHKANIEFSNEGIKASNATAVGGMGAARGGFEHLFKVPVEEIDMTFNKPYMYLIRDKETGEVWFTGTVYNP